MGFASYAAFQTAVGDWLNRGDLAGAIPTFIFLAEAEFNRTIRVRDMIVRDDSVVLDDQFTSLPAGFLEFDYVQLADDPNPIENVGSTEELIKQRRELYWSPAKPRVFALNGSDIEVAPAPDQAYDAEWAFYTGITPLADAPNWLFTKHPDVYLYGTLMHSAPYLKDDARVTLWTAAYERATASMRAADERAKLGGSPPRRRVPPIG